MQVVVQSDLFLVDLAFGKRRKFGVAAVETGDASREMRLSNPSLELCMALRTTRLARSRQACRTAMLPVAGGAMGREPLIVVVRWAVMTGETSFVARLLEEGSSPSHMTKAALLSKDRVSLGEGAAGIGFLTPLNSLRQEPADRQSWNRHR